MLLKNLKNSHIAKKIRNEFSKDAVAAGTVKLVSGNLLAQIVNFAASPVLSRLYSTDVFGIYTVFASLLFIGSTLLVAQYDQAIPVEADFSGTKSLVNLCRHISYFFLIPLFVGSLIYMSLQSIYVERIQLVAFAATLTVTGFLQAIANVYSKILIKYKQYRAQSTSLVLYSSSYAMAAIIIHYVSNTVNALIYAYLFSEIVTSLVRVYYVRKIEEWESPFESREKEMAKKYIRFPRYSIFSSFLNSFSTNMPSLMIQSLFGASLVGIYGMANRIVGIPFSVISTSVSSVFYQEASNKYNSGSNELTDIGDSAFQKLTLCSVIPMTALLVLGDILFKIVLGSQWEDSGKICQLLAVWMSVVFSVSPLMGIYGIKQKQYVMVGINLALLIFRASALILGGLISDNFTLAMLLYSLAGAGVWIVVYCMVTKELHLSFKRNTLFFIKLYVPCIIVMYFIRKIFLLLL